VEVIEVDAVIDRSRQQHDERTGHLPEERSLRFLLEAHDNALELGLDVWEFAVEIRSLLAAGLSHSNLRCFQCRGFTQHAFETTRPEDLRRSFRPASNLRFEETSCFVLTTVGVQYARLMTGRLGGGAAAVSRPPAQDVVPVWDHARLELRVGGVVVKQFKAPAPNQEAVLAAFQEEGWPARIDDPIPPQLNQDSKRRLHDTINALNRNQKIRLIRFLGDGHGLGVRWELVAPSDADA
jgi:hypothetical protein